jgi:hypothetical protein
MKVSEEQVRKVLEEKIRSRSEKGTDKDAHKGEKHTIREPQVLYRGVVAEPQEVSPHLSPAPADASAAHGGEAHPDADLIAEVRDLILNMPEVREELVAELRDRIERGEYHVSARDIAEAMVRRAIADRAGD